MGILEKSLSLIKRMDKRMTLSEAQKMLENDDFIPFDIMSIPIEELRAQYLDYSYELPFTKFDSNRMVSEDVQHTNPLRVVKPKITEKFYLKDWQFLIRTARNKIDVALITPNINTSKDMVIQSMAIEGYFRARERILVREDMEWVQMQFEPYNQDDINDDVSMDEIVYHMTPISNAESIEKHGIMPSNKNTDGYGPKRVFVLRGYVEPFAWKTLANDLNNSLPNKEDAFVVYHIQVNKLPNGVNFYADPEHEHAAFTDSPIPISAIIDKTVIPLTNDRQGFEK